MNGNRIFLSLCFALTLAMCGCSRQQSDWQKTRETNTTDSYEQYLKKYPTGEFTAQAQARVKELYEERDWQKARDTDTAEAYQAFLKQYPDGKWTEEARIRVENFTLAQAPSGTGTSAAAAAGTATSSDSIQAAVPGEQSAPPPTPTPTRPQTSTSASAKATVKAAAGLYAIQLGAFRSGSDAARQRWTNLQQQYPSILSGLSSRVMPKKTASGNLYRLQAIGLTERHARAICGSLTANSQPCVVVPPA